MLRPRLLDAVTSAFPDFDLYEELEVSRRASPAVISAAYKRLARDLHPDSGSPSADSSRMVRLNVAHEVLSDDEKRAASYAARGAGSHESEPRVRNDEPSLDRADPLFIGIQLSWERIKRAKLGVLGFTALARRDGNKVNAPPAPAPYALADVEVLFERPGSEPMLATLPIHHREDFKVLDWAWSLSQGAEAEIELEYEPGGLFSSMRPRLRVRAYPSGHWNTLKEVMAGEMTYIDALTGERSELMRAIFTHDPGSFTVPD